MKIGKSLFFVMLALLFCVSTSYADLSSVAGKLDFTGKVDTGDSAPVIGLSPKVQMYYVSNGGTTVNSQWYAISAGHPGGNTAYGTAQDVNNIFIKSYSTSDELSTYLKTIPTDGGSEGAWTDESWERI